MDNPSEQAYRIATQFDAHRNGLPADWQDWAAEISRELHALSRASTQVCMCPEHGRWLAADDILRNVRSLDVALNGEAGAAPQAKLCDIVGQVEAEARKRGMPVLTALSHAAAVEGARPMESAPRDGTMVRLLVQFDDHSTEDTTGPAWTIGACNDDNVPDDERIGWQFAGWCWTHDHFTEGKGTPVGWLPMLATTAAQRPGAEDAGMVERVSYALSHADGNAYTREHYDTLAEWAIKAVSQPASGKASHG